MKEEEEEAASRDCARGSGDTAAGKLEKTASFVSEGDYLSAARKAAYSIVLREIKSKDMGGLKGDLKRYAMESPPL